MRRTCRSSSPPTNPSSSEECKPKKHKNTPRQFEALESLCLNNNAHMKRETLHSSDRTVWTHVRRAGGSQAQISDALIGHGFMSNGATGIYSREVAREFNYYRGQITAAGLQFLIEQSQDAAVVEKAKAALPDRLKLEADFTAAYEAKVKEIREANERIAARNRAAHMAELRKRFEKWDDTLGCNGELIAMTDEQMLEMARDLEGAEYAYKRETEEA